MEEYLQLSSDSDSSFIVKKFTTYLNTGDQILELGSGPGRDLAELENVTYSDFSPLFIDYLKNKYPNARVLELNAVSIETPDRFNAIYSNKVLHHLSDEELLRSFSRQAELLKGKGIICHTFWAGTKNEEYKGLIFNHHTIKELKKMIEGLFDVLFIGEYEEFVPGDSILLIAEIKH